jgi:hypothetical protein
MESNIAEVRYNVVCYECGQVWSPTVKSPLWWKAKQRSEQGYLDALHVSGEECGCKQPVAQPDAPFRVVGYDDMCRDFDIPYYSLVKAARKYLKLARDGMYVVSFVDNRTGRTRKRTKLQERLDKLVWA